MKIMSFNIWFGGERPLGEVTCRRPIIQNVIKREDPDVLGLLECNGWIEDLNIFQDYEKSLKMRGFLLPTKSDPKNNAFNIALFVKPELRVESMVMDAVHFWHGVIIAKVAIQGALITLAVTHLNPNSPSERLQEANFILNRVPKESCVVMGDLNSLSPTDGKEVKDIPTEYQNRHVTDGKVDVRVIKQFEQFGLVDSFRYFCPDRIDYTAPTPVANDPAFQGAKLRLDYIFLSDPLKVFLTKAKIIKTEESNLASDHFPVLAELSI